MFSHNTSSSSVSTAFDASEAPAAEFARTSVDLEACCCWWSSSSSSSSDSESLLCLNLFMYLRMLSDLRTLLTTFLKDSEGLIFVEAGASGADDGEGDGWTGSSPLAESPWLPCSRMRTCLNLFVTSSSNSNLMFLWMLMSFKSLATTNWPLMEMTFLWLSSPSRWR